jgi:hypothetical protein
MISLSVPAKSRRGLLAVVDQLAHESRVAVELTQQTLQNHLP